MMPESRRRGIAALATALAAMALAVGVAGRDCGQPDDGPDNAVRAFAEASREGAELAAYELLGPKTRAWLDHAAERATHMVGGSRRYSALDLLAVGGVRMPSRISVVKSGDKSAVVEVVDAQGGHSTIDLVKIGSHWRLELMAESP